MAEMLRNHQKRENHVSLSFGLVRPSRVIVSGKKP